MTASQTSALTGFPPITISQLSQAGGGGGSVLHHLRNRFGLVNLTAENKQTNKKLIIFMKYSIINIISTPTIDTPAHILFIYADVILAFTEPPLKNPKLFELPCYFACHVCEVILLS